jgi:hypothetical protein
MILALAVVVGLLTSFLRHRGQTTGQLADIPLRSAWMALLAVALQVPLLRAPFGPLEEVALQQVLFLFSHLVLLAFVWQNRHLVGIWIVGLGVLCNLMVIVTNGGFMPVMPETLAAINPGSGLDQWPTGFHYGYSKDIILLREETVLWVLSDMLVLPPPFPWPTAFSLGDLLIAAGIVVLLQGPVKWPRAAMLLAFHLRGRLKGGMAAAKTRTEEQERVSYEAQKS